MLAKRLPTIRVDPPDSQRLLVSFYLLWFVDMVTAAFLILLPRASELNPVTVFFYMQFGLLGVVIAACCYALIVLAVANYLIHPLDLAFLGGIAFLYCFFVFNNFMVLVFDQPLAALPSEVPIIGV